MMNYHMYEFEVTSRDVCHHQEMQTLPRGLMLHHLSVG